MYYPNNGMYKSTKIFLKKLVVLRTDFSEKRSTILQCNATGSFVQKVNLLVFGLVNTKLSVLTRVDTYDSWKTSSLWSGVHYTEFSHLSIKKNIREDQWEYKWKHENKSISENQTVCSLQIYFLKKSLNDISFRSCPAEVFLRKRDLKICSKFTGEHPCRSEPISHLREPQ